ncbi:methyl-accepting chemotaxis protein [candidate division CSSED10-310 bacterium]|uniref:Methyl-accepting chemotaxis protein n=1 Tax=candidate division CSSED10-310 bacterium TaxID=2855610 RepID=A0ABV6YQY0_UNCC1
MKKGTQLKRRLDMINTVLAVVGTIFLVFFIRNTISLEPENLRHFIMVVIAVALVVFPIFLVLVTIWLKPLFSFLDSSREGHEAALTREAAISLVRQAMLYPVRHISAAMICWNAAAVLVGVISTLIGALILEECLILINTVFIFSILINMISYRHVRLIIPPVVEEATARVGTLNFIPEGTLSSVRSKIMTFVGAIIIFLILFFLQLIAISAVMNRQHLLEEISRDKLDEIRAHLSFRKGDLENLRCQDIIGGRIKGLTEIVIFRPDGQTLCGKPSKALTQTVDNFQQQPVQGKQKLFSPIYLIEKDKSGFLIVIAYNWQEFDLPLIYTSLWNLFFVGFTGLIALYLGRMIAYDISDSLTDLTRSMESIAQGEGDLTRRIVSYSSQEIIELSAWFNKFISRLSDIIKNSQTLASHVSDSMKVMHQRSEEFIREGQQQGGAIQEVITTGKSYEAMNKTLNRNIHDVHELSGQSLNSAQVGLQSIHEISAGVDSIVQTSHVANASFLDLQAKSDAINQINELVDNLANQTRLLSFNAMLEAISAGGKGSRFTVVAEAIRALADDVTSSTDQIQSVIKEITFLIDELGQQNKLEQEQLEDLKSKIKSARSEFDQIVAQSDKTVHEISRLKQSFSSQQRYIEESTKRIFEMAANTEKVVATGNLFQELIEQLNVMTKRQEENIKRFKVT